MRWAKEQWHVSYVFSSWKNSPASADGKFVGFKAVMYNTVIDGETAVKLELWVDPSNDNNWQKVMTLSIRADGVVTEENVTESPIKSFRGVVR